MQNATLHCHHETDQGVDTFLSGGRGKSTFMPNIIPHHCIHYDLEMEEKQNEEKKYMNSLKILLRILGAWTPDNNSHIFCQCLMFLHTNHTDIEV